jgi:hypothetical protein
MQPLRNKVSLIGTVKSMMYTDLKKGPLLSMELETVETFKTKNKISTITNIQTHNVCAKLKMAKIMNDTLVPQMEVIIEGRLDYSDPSMTVIQCTEFLILKSKKKSK